MIELHARQRALAAEARRLRGEASNAAAAAADVFELERLARERVTRARASVALMPPRVDPADAQRASTLANAAERLASCLDAAVRAGSRFEAPLRGRVDAGAAASAKAGEELRLLGAQEADLRRAATEAASRLSELDVESARLAAERAELDAATPRGGRARRAGRAGARGARGQARPARAASRHARPGEPARRRGARARAGAPRASSPSSVTTSSARCESSRSCGPSSPRPSRPASRRRTQPSRLISPRSRPPSSRAVRGASC